MNSHRLSVGVVAPLALARALTGTAGVAWAAPPKPHPPAIPAARCTAQHGTVVQIRSKKEGTLKKRCQGGTLNGRKIAP